MVMNPVGFGTKNHCAGEGQQQFCIQSVLDSHGSEVVSWGNGLGARKSPASKDVSTEAEYIVKIRYQATIGEDIAN
jgi:hypothetical protein